MLSSYLLELGKRMADYLVPQRSYVGIDGVPYSSLSFLAKGLEKVACFSKRGKNGKNFRKPKGGNTPKERSSRLSKRNLSSTTDVKALGRKANRNSRWK